MQVPGGGSPATTGCDLGMHTDPLTRTVYGRAGTRLPVSLAPGSIAPVKLLFWGVVTRAVLAGDFSDKATVCGSPAGDPQTVSYY